MVSLSHSPDSDYLQSLRSTPFPHILNPKFIYLPALKECLNSSLPNVSQRFVLASFSTPTTLWNADKIHAQELQKARQKLPPGITLVKADDLKTWELDIQVLDSNPIYANQIFRLVFIFTDNYPIEPPEVTFLYVPPSPTSTSSSTNNSFPSTSSQQSQQNGIIDLTKDDDPPISVPGGFTPQQAPPVNIDNGHRPIPLHPHVYTNGIICLDLLGTAGWSPVQSVESVCMSLQSMLTGNYKAERPHGDKEFCASMGPRGKDGWKSGGGWGRRGLRDVRFEYDDETV